MATQNMKRFGIPTALVVGGVTAGSLFAPIGLAAAQEADTDTEPDTTVESDAAESETGEDTERDGRRSDRRAAKAEALTEALGLTIDEIKAGFSEGNSIADLAEAQGVSTDDVKAALVAAANERIDAAVESGRLDEAEADEKRAELDERIDQMITADPSEFQGRRGNGNRGGHGKSGFASEVVTETLGLTSEEIRASPSMTWPPPWLTPPPSGSTLPLKKARSTPTQPTRRRQNSRSASMVCSTANCLSVKVVEVTVATAATAAVTPQRPPSKTSRTQASAPNKIRFSPVRELLPSPRPA